MANEEYNTNTEINDYLTVATDAVTGVNGLGDGPTGGGGGTTIVRCVDGSINTSTSGNICTISVSSNYLKKTDADSKYATRTDLTSNYVSKTDAASTYAAKTDLTNKQDKLTAGSNISIVGNVISATGGGSGTSYVAGNGINISGNTISADTSTMATKTDLTGKQDKLTAGSNITIVGNVISATGGGGGTSYTAGNGINISGTTISADTSVVATKTDLSGKQDTLTAGTGINISGNVISATGGGASYNYISEDTSAHTLTLGTAETTGGVKLGSKLIKKYEKWVIVGVYGQSNAVGYDESMLTKYDVPCEEGRVMQCAGNSIEPLYFCAKNLQDMNNEGKRAGSATDMAAVRTNSMTGDAFTPSYVDRTTKVATKGIHLPLANMICSVIPDDYGVIIVPAARGGRTLSTFTKGNADYNSFRDRLKYALGLHEDNVLAGIVWCQGEYDATQGTTAATYKTNFSQMITDLDNDIKTDNYKKLVHRTDPKQYWFVFEWPKHYKDQDRNNLLGAMKEVVGESHYAAIPDDTPSNDTDFTSATRQAHFGHDSYRKVIAPRVFAKMHAAGVFQLSAQEVADNSSDSRIDELEAQVGNMHDLITALQARVDELSAFHQLPPIEDTKVLTASMITKGHSNGVLSDFTVVDGVLTIGTGSNIGGGTGALMLDDSITMFEGTFQTVGSNLASSFIAITAKSAEKEEGFFLNPVQNNKTYTSNASFTTAALNGNYTPTPVSAGQKLTMEKTGNVVKVMLDDTVVFEGDMADKVWSAATCTEACLGFGGAWTNRSNPGWVLTDCKVKMA